jgi:hypothetical protein
MIGVKSSAQLTLRDRLSRLTFEKACQLLGPNGKKLIPLGGHWPINLEEDVFLGDDLFRLTCAMFGDRPGAIVTITLMAEARDRMHWRCDQCEGACEHVGAAFSTILESKTALGLATPPPERVPVASLSEKELVEAALSRTRRH